MKKIIGTILFGIVTAAASFAAEIPADVRDALKDLKQYDQSQPRAPLFTLEQFVARSTGTGQGKQIAAMLAEALDDSNTTAVAKTIICQQLAKVGTDAEVPELAKLLDDPQLSDPARFALEGMRTQSADSALRESLARLKGKQLVGAINSLGNRRDVASLAPFQGLLSNSDRDVSIAAAHALGSIGTREAAAAVAKSDDVPAKLLCAQRLLQNGFNPMAVGLCRMLAASGNPPDQRVAAMMVLADAHVLDSENYIIFGIADADPLVSASAIRLSSKIKNPKAVAALTEQLKKPDATRQVLVLSAFAERRDTVALAAVEEAAASSNEDVRVAAFATLGVIGNANTVKILAKAAAEEKGRVKTAAEEALAGLPADVADGAIIAGISSGGPALRAAMIATAAARNLTAASAPLMKAVADKNKTIRAAAAQALAKIGRAEDYEALVNAMLDAKDASCREVLGAAVSAVGKRINDQQAKIAPLAAALKRENISTDGIAAVLHALAGIGGADSLAAVSERINADNEAVRDAAVRALADWPDGAAIESLMKIAEGSSNSLHKTLALRGVIRLAPAEVMPMKLLEQIQSLAHSKDEKQQLLSALSQLKEPGALAMAANLVSEKDVTAEAVLAATQIAKSLVKSHPDAVDAAMAKVLEADKKSAEAKNLQSQARKILKAKSETSRARRDEIAKSLPAGSRLAAYLDCGVESGDQSAAGVRLWVAHGKDYDWREKGGEGSPVALTVTFGSGNVRIDASGLDAEKKYDVGFAWWDYDDNKREQSVWVSGKQIVEKTTLPAWQGKQQGPATLTRAVPADAIHDGKIEITFKQEGTGNCVVSEIWLVEKSGAAEMKPEPPAVKTAQPKPEPAPAVKTPETKPTAAPVAAKVEAKPAPAPLVLKRTNPSAETKVLIVTGLEYPGHPWRETAPLLQEIISKDDRLSVDVNDNANAALESPDLGKNAVIILNYMNWKDPGPGAAAQENLRKAVENGTGLVMVHFACGAFQEWPEFVKIAGRVWNPKFRGHDARGPFKVEIADTKHPVTSGLEAFDTDDELYTCLDGSTPIEILATATSKVDHKVYPMAFVLQYGKGRVFHCVLGHDAKAFKADGVQSLYRRGTAWAAGLEPK